MNLLPACCASSAAWSSAATGQREKKILGELGEAGGVMLGEGKTEENKRKEEKKKEKKN